MGGKINIAKIAIGGLFILEVLLLTFWNGKFGAHKSSLMLLVASLGIGVLGIYFSMTNFKASRIVTFQPKFLKVIISCLVPIIFTVWIGSILNGVFTANPLDKLDVSKSDIIPLVMFMVDRFLGGEYPYAPISDWGYTLTPTYMPMQWLPYSLASIFNFDFRWIPFSVLVLALALFQIDNYKRKSSTWSFLLFTLLPWLVWLLIVRDDPEVFGYTIECLSAGYYIILCLCILSRKPVLIGLGIGLCLLSRYSFVLWLPLLGFVFLLKDYRKLLPIVGIPFLMLILIYVLPFLSKDVSAFQDSLSSYTAAAEGEWAPYWQSAEEKPYHLFRGFGVAGIFYDFGSGTKLERIKNLQFWHFSSSLGITLLLCLFYFIFKKRIRIEIFLLSSLKVYFVFFYYFIQVPYSYLFIVPLFVSVMVLYAVQIKAASDPEYG